MLVAACVAVRLAAADTSLVLGPAVFNTTTAAVSERVECRIVTDRLFENPYDPACVRLDAVIVGPSGMRLYPCFYRVRVAEDGSEARTGEWVFHHAFRMEGVYAVSFRLACAGGVAMTPPHTVVVAGRRSGGFIRPDAFHDGLWIRDDGTRVFASGLNVAWSEGDDRGLYRDVLAKCAASGIRFIRVWMIGFAKQELEWSETLWEPWNSGYGLGRYNQRVAAFFDWLFEAAAEQGVAIQLVLETHGEWSTEVNANWEFNPYNAQVGGFLDSPAAFFSDPEAQRRAKARYRYCVARWGAEPALAAWELFNEADLTDAVRLDGEEQSVAAWHQEQARFIQLLDAVPRPIVSSATDIAFLGQMAAAAPALDRLDLHLYRDDAVRVWEQDLRAWRQTGAFRAALAGGEFGVSEESETEPEDLLRVRGMVRRMTWRGRLAGFPAWYWFWNKAEAAGAFEVNRAVSAVFADWDPAAVVPMDARAVGGQMPEAFAVTPVWGWMATATNSHRVVFDGATNRLLHGQSEYLHGDWKAGLGRSLRLEGDFAADGAFEVVVAGASAAGGNELVIGVDGAEVWRRPVAAGARLLVRVGEGRHALELYNAGRDWLRIGRLVLHRPEAPPAEAVAVTDSWRTVAYVADKRFIAGCGDEAGALAGVALRLRAPAVGFERLRVLFVSPADGAAIGSTEVAVDETGDLLIPLPPFAQDLVVVVE